MADEHGRIEEEGWISVSHRRKHSAEYSVVSVRLCLVIALAFVPVACGAPPAPTLVPIPQVTCTMAPSVTPLPSPTPLAHLPRGESSLLLNDQCQNQAYSGIVRVHGSGDCTGAWIKTVEGEAAMDACAYVLTAGHCAWAMRPNEVLIDWVDEDFLVVFGMFYDTLDLQEAIAVKRIAYATVKGRDVALLELDTKYAELLGKGYQPLRLSGEAVQAGEPVAVVGAPIEDIPTGEQCLRITSCSLDEQVDLIEGAWHFFDEYRTDCADIHHGSSGSPVISRDSGELVAVLNTATISPWGDCYANRPCEISSEGVAIREGTSYAVPVVGLDRCFDAQGSLDLSLRDCPLDRGRGLRVAGQPDWATQPHIEGSDGQVQRAAWNAIVAGKYYRYFRYKVGPAGQTDCREMQGYGPAIHVTDSNRIDDQLPDAEGFYVLCLLGGNSPQLDETWQEPASATMVQTLVDCTPPALEPDIDLTELSDSWWIVYRYFPPEIEQYQLKVGSPEETECGDLEGYFLPRVGALRLHKDQGPYRVCAIGLDRAGNPGTPKGWVLR